VISNVIDFNEFDDGVFHAVSCGKQLAMDGSPQPQGVITDDSGRIKPTLVGLQIGKLTHPDRGGDFEPGADVG
jgi:hypothetical protein